MEFGAEVFRVATASLNRRREDRADPFRRGLVGREVGGRADRAYAGDAVDQEGRWPAAGAAQVYVRPVAQAAARGDQYVGAVRARVPYPVQGERRLAGQDGFRAREGDRLRVRVEDGGEQPLAQIRSAGLYQDDAGQRALPGAGRCAAGVGGAGGQAGGA